MPGERRLIIGPNGAGKTTLFNLITGDLIADAGSVKLFGSELAGMPTEKRVHLGLARTYQILTLFPRETLLHNVKLALLGLDRRAGIRGLCAVRAAPRWTKPRRRRSTGRLGRQRRNAWSPRPPMASGGGWNSPWRCAQKPKLLLLDEPLAGLSQEERKTVSALLKTIPRDVTIVMIEHDMDTALEFAERITLLHYGEVIVEGTRAEVVADPRTREVYLGD